ncbi:hypothetical protein [Microbaculum sp. FT89]|uniref:hypothetical protein n=1 Tax=Microbaculum sp. FT89 TaxID=3447298 RepID=UPI003F5308CD
MAAVLKFNSDMRRSRRQPEIGARSADKPEKMGEVIIFPGVRIERMEIDLSHRLVQVSGPGEGPSGSTADKP